MRKKLFKRKTCLKAILTLLVVSLLCAGCIKIPDEEVPITLSVSDNSLRIVSSGESQSVNITSNDEWHIKKDASWLTVIPSNGINSERVTVSAERNTSTSSRNTTITIISNISGVSAQNISVTQAEATMLSVSPNSLYFAASGASHTFNITSNDGWYVSKEASWLTVSPSTGNNNRTVTVTADRNTATSSRNATITVRSNVSGVSAQNISVTQAEATTTLSVSPNSLSFTSSAASQTFTVTSNNGWYVSKEASWLSVSPSTGNNNRTVTVNVDRNTSTSSRNATITVRSNVSGVSTQNISVTQAGAPIPTTAQVRFRKDGAYTYYTSMGIENSSRNLVVSHYFGSGSGTSGYYTVTAGTYYPVAYISNMGYWEYYYLSDGIYRYSFAVGYRYTMRLHSSYGGYALSITNDGSF